MADSTRKTTVGVRRVSSFNGKDAAKITGFPLTGIPNTSRRGQLTPKATTPVEPTRPKPTIHELISICERLQTGNYVRGAGVAQFYEEIAAAKAAKFGKKNLQSQLAELEDKTVVACPSTYPGLPSSKGEAVTQATDEVDDEPIKKFKEIEDNYGSLPEHFKRVDRYIVERQALLKNLIGLASARSETTFGKIVQKEKYVKLFGDIDRIGRTVEKFMSKPGWDVMDLFQPPKTGTGSVPFISADVREQELIISSLSKLGVQLERLYSILQGDKSPDFRKILADMHKLAEEYEEELKREGALKKKVDRLLLVLGILEEDDDNGRGEDSDSDSDTSSSSDD